MDDSGIVDLYLARDETAIIETQRKYGQRLSRIACNILDSAESAEECENDTYLEAWNRIPPHEPRTYLFSFLGKITRHLAIDRCRKNTSLKRQALFCELTAEMEECIPGRSSAEEAVDAKALKHSIDAYLSGLSVPQQNVFVRRYWFFDSIADIARQYGFSQSKVKTMLFRMREGLRTHLEKEGYII